MENIANVDIDASGRFKYILIKIKSVNNEKYVVRGYAWAEYHGKNESIIEIKFLM